MESMEYNFVGGGVPQIYPYIGCGADMSILQQDGSPYTISNGPHRFDTGIFNHTYPAETHTGLITTPNMATSPRSSQHSPLPNMSLGSAYNMKFDERSNRTSSSEETDELYAAQARRKAQNRAAQRAFRERKERHVRDLETKIGELETAMCSLKSSNERLESMLQRAQLENEMLRARSSSLPFERKLTSHTNSARMVQPTLPLQVAPANDSTQASHSSIKNAPVDDTDSLSATAVLDLLQTHPLYLAGTLDIGKVCEKLKEKAQCDGLKESVLSRHIVCGIIEEVGSSGGDVIRSEPTLVDPSATL